MAAGYTVRIDRFQIRVQSIEAGRRLITQVVREVHGGAERILATGPYTHGRLIRGLEDRIQYGPYEVVGRVGISGRKYPYAASVEGGAKRHHIFPHPPRRYLKFYWRKVGRTVWFRRVNHPGQKGKGYLRRPLALAAARHNMKVVIYDS